MNSILNRFEFRLEADKPTELNLYLYSQVRGGCLLYTSPSPRDA